MIKEIQGNLFNTDANIIVHGCNAQGKMGSGVAKYIREAFPKAYDGYIQHQVEFGLKLGDIIPVEVMTDHYIINAITQKFYGYDGKLYTDYEAVRTCMSKIAHMASKDFKIAMPKIGCGLGGGDWKIIKQIIEEELADFEVEIFYL